ncbi:MAG: hypothetical protein ABH834_05560 [Candidatus Altiarchaeota archaeon]
MGFLDFLLGGGEKNSGDSETVAFDGLSPWIIREKEKTGRKILENARDPIKHILDGLTEINRQLDEISAKKQQDSVPDRFRKIIDGSKPKYLKDMRAFVSDATPAKTDSLDELSSYVDRLTRLLEDIAKINLGEGRYLPLAYGVELEKIQKKAKLMQDERDNIKAILSDEQYEKMTGIERLLEKINETSSPQENAPTASDYAKRIQELEGKIEKTRKELKKLEEGKELKAITDKKNTLHEKKKELEKIENQIHASLRSLDRVMKRYKKPCPDELSPALEAVLQGPVAFFLLDSENQTRALLNALLAAVESDSFDAKDKDKTVRKIHDAMEKLTPQLKSEHDELSNETKNLSEEISGNPVESRIQKLCSEEKRIREKREKALEDSRNAEKRGKQRKAERAKLTKELSKRLSEDFNVTLR